MRARAAVLTMAVALLGAACGGADGDDRGSKPTAELSASSAPAPDPPSSTPRRTDPPAGGMDAVARERYLPMWNKPRVGEADFVYDARRPTGSGIAPMLIDDRRTLDGRRWVRILLPIRPNGSAGWTPVDEVKLIPRDEKIVVDLSERMLRHYVDGELRDRIRVGIGTPATPTGTGTFYVWQRVSFANPNSPYGIFALGLSGFSPVLSDWPGGGRMAIHGTPDASDRGRAVSHGCVRVYNGDMKPLLDVPLGTPVIIRR